MAVKTFSVNEVLTASDTNTYLNNGGLVLITSGITASAVGGSTQPTVSNGAVTVGTGNTSVTVLGAFSATYDSYKIIYTGGSSTANGAISFALNGSPVGWYGNLIYANFGAGAPASAGYNNTTNLTHAGSVAGLTPQLNIEVQNPFLAKPTYAGSRFVDATNAGHVMGIHADAISYNGFVLAHASGGSFTGGVIRVYGFRQA